MGVDAILGWFGGQRDAARGVRGPRHRDGSAGPPAGGRPLAIALEPRYMYDAAGVAAGGEAAADAAAQQAADSAMGEDGALNQDQQDRQQADDEALAQALADAAPPADRTEVVFVDTSVADWQTLAAGVGDGAEVVLLDADSPALAQIAAALDGRTGVEAIHIVSHGDTGALTFGSGTVDAGNLGAFSDELGRIGAALSETGDILLYGCYVGAEGEGQAFIDALASATDADVAASDDLTGAESLGGDWDLEVEIRHVERSAVLAAISESDFSNTLALTLESSTQVVFDDTTEYVGNNSVLRLADGGYMAFYSGGPTDAFLFDANGVKKAAEFTGTDYISTENSGYDIAPLDSGAYALTWTEKVSGSNVGVLFRVLDSNFNVIVDTTRVEEVTSGTQQLPRIVSLGTSGGEDRFVITFNQQSVTQKGVFRIYDFDGTNVTAVTGETDFPTSNGGMTQNRDALGAMGNGDFVVVHRTGADQVFKADVISGDGTTIHQGIELSPSVDSSGAPIAKVTGFGNGSFAAVIQVEPTDTASRKDVLVFVNDSGTLVNTVDIATVGNSNSSPTISVTQDGNLLLSYNISTDGDNVNDTLLYAVYDQSGNVVQAPSSDIFVAGDSSYPDFLGGAHAQPDGKIIAYYDNWNEDTFETDSFFRIYTDQPPNTAPTIALSGTQANFTEDGGAVTVDGALTLDDPENDSITGATVSITSNFQAGDVLAVTVGATGITQSYDAGTGMLTLSGTTTEANYQSVLQSLTFNNTGDDPSTATRTITYSVTDSGSSSPGTATQGVTVTAVNDAPTATGTISSTALNDNAGAQAIFGSVVVGDVDSGETDLTVEIRLSNAAAGTIAGGGFTDVGGGVYRLTGQTAASANTALDSVTFTPANNTGPSGTFQTGFTVAVDDQTAAEVTHHAGTVTVTRINDAPTINTGSVALTGIDENTTSGGTLISALLADRGYGDVDTGAQSGIAVTAATGNGTWQYSADGTSWTAFGTVAGNAALLLSSTTQVRYIPDGQNGETATFTFRAWDQTSGTASINGGPQTGDSTTNGGATAFSANTASASLTVSAVNDAPVLTPATPTLTGIDEDATTNGGQTVAGILGTSVEDADTGAVEGIAVTAVTGSATWQYSTNSGTNWTAVGAVAGNNALLLRATDLVRYVPNGQNGETATITYRAWDQTSGTPGATVDVSTNGGTTAFSTATDTASLIVAAVNDPPVLANLDGTPGFTEGGATVVLDSNVTVSDVELGSLNGGNGNFAGASLTIVRNGGADAQDTFSIQTGGSLTVAGSTVSAGGNVIASFDTSAAGQVTVTFQDNGTIPTTALVNEVMQAIRYANIGDDPASNIQLTWTFSDGNAGTQGSGGVGTDTGSVTVSITGVNDPPTLTATGQNPTFIEGAAAPGVDLFSTVTASTVEAADRFAALTLTVTNVSDGAAEILRFDGSDVALTHGTGVTTATNGLTVNVSVTGSTATVSFTGATLTAAQVQTLVDGLAYRNTSDDPTTGSNRVVTITGIADNGGTSGGGQNSAAPNLASTVSLTAVNDPPVVGGVFGDSSSQVTAGAGAQDVTGLNDATVSNADSADYSGGFLTVAQSGGTTNGSWGLDGITATAGGDGTIAAGETIAIGGVAIGTVHAIDDGQGGNSLRVYFNANATSAAIETLLRALTYSGPSGLGDRTFTLTLNDNDGTANGGDQDASGTFTIDVTPNPPTIAGLNGDSVSAANGTAVAVDAGGNSSVTDADSANFNGGNLSVSRTSGLAGSFSLDGTTATSGGDATIAGGETIRVGGTDIGTVTTDGQGTNDLVITFNADATPALVTNLIRNLQFAATDAGAHTFDVTVTDAAAGPDAATSAAAGIAVNVDAVPVNTVPGAQTAVDGTPLALAGISVADADSATVTTTVSVPGGDGTFAATGAATITGDGTNSIVISGTVANVNATLANLEYTPAVNATGAQTITVETSDGSASPGGPNTDTDTITVTVSDRPSIAALDGDALTFDEGDGPLLLDQGTAATVTDADSADFDGGNVTVSIAAGGIAAEDVLSVRNQGTGGGQIGFNGGTGAVSFGGTQIGTAAGGTGGANLVITLNANATPTAVSALLRTITYDNSGGTTPTAGDRTVRVTVTDAAGGNTSAPADVTVTVVAVPPAAPSVPDLTAGSDTGSSSTDSITNDTTPTFDGTGETGATVTLFRDANGNGALDGGESLGTGLVAGGTWSITSTATLADGVHAIRAFQTDTKGNVSPVSAALSVTVDTTAPTPALASVAGPTRLDPFPVTIDFGEAVTGFAVADITVGGAGGTVTGLVDQGGGRFTATVDAAADGTVTLTIAGGIAQDLAGNANLAATQVSIAVDTTPPAAPTVATPAAAQTVDADSFAITGTAEAGSLVRVFVDADGDGVLDAGETTLAGSQQLAAGATSFSITVPLTQNAANEFVVVARDAAGNVGSAADVATLTEAPPGEEDDEDEEDDAGDVLFRTEGAEISFTPPPREQWRRWRGRRRGGDHRPDRGRRRGQQPDRPVRRLDHRRGQRRGRAQPAVQGDDRFRRRQQLAARQGVRPVRLDGRHAGRGRRGRLDPVRVPGRAVGRLRARRGGARRPGRAAGRTGRRRRAAGAGGRRSHRRTGPRRRRRSARRRQRDDSRRARRGRPGRRLGGPPGAARRAVVHRPAPRRRRRLRRRSRPPRQGPGGARRAPAGVSRAGRMGWAGGGATPGLAARAACHTAACGQRRAGILCRS